MSSEKVQLKNTPDKAPGDFSSLAEEQDLSQQGQSVKYDVLGVQL